MALGKKKYLNPSKVLDAVVDDQGDKVAIGDEKDINEYNVILLQRIQDAFDYAKQTNFYQSMPATRALGDQEMQPEAEDTKMMPEEPPALET
jgi:hypothetical protein